LPIAPRLRGVASLSRMLSELDIKVYKYLLEKNGEGVPQNVLWKDLGISSRDASRAVKKLESLGLVVREPITFEGHRTYLIKLVKKDPSLISIESPVKTSTASENIAVLNDYLEIPCMYCPYIYTSCYVGGYYDPRNCQWLAKWISEKVSKKKHEGET